MGFLDERGLPHLVSRAPASGRPLLGAHGLDRRERRARRLHVLDVPSAARGRMGARAPAPGLFSEGRTQEEAAPLIAPWRAPRDVEAFIARLARKLGPIDLSHIRTRRTFVQPVLQRRQRAAAAFGDQLDRPIVAIPDATGDRG